MRALRISSLFLLASGCVNCPAIVVRSVIVEAHFMGGTTPVTDATVECTTGGVTTTADDSERAAGRYSCFGPAGTYQIRLMRGGIVSGSSVDVPGPGACGEPVEQTVSIGVFGP